MGQISGHEKYIHVYINGLYWGVYSLAEKINNDFIAEYAPGDDTQFDVINDDNLNSIAVDGNITAYNLMMSYANSSNYNKLVSEKLLDCVNYVDYMILNYYIGNRDWDGNNWFAARNRITPENGFRYFSWDAENCLTDVNYNLVKIVDKTLTKMFNNLSKNIDFKLLVADRLQKHLFNGGALTTENSILRYQKLASLIDTAMISESARWGDYRKDIVGDLSAVLYTYKGHWLPRKQNLLSGYFPARSGVLLSQFKDAGYIPNTSAPFYNSQGGYLTEQFDLTISAEKGLIYYTTDGSDPRTQGSSAVSPLAKIYSQPLHVVGSGILKSRAKNGAEWSAIAEVSFKGMDSLIFISNETGLQFIETNTVSDIYYSNSGLYYTIPDKGTLKLEIFSIDGRLLMTYTDYYLTSGNKNTLLSNICNIKGLYIYRLNFKDIIATGKIIIP